MKHKGTYTTCLIMLLAVSMQVQAAVPIPDPLPQIDFAFSPPIPTSDDVVDLRLSGLWPYDCVPEGANVVVNGDTIEVRMLLPGAVDCVEPCCRTILSAYELNVSVGPLPVGTYSVFARAVTCRAASNTQFVGSFTVGSPAGEPNEPGEPNAVTPGTCVVLLQDIADGNSVLEAGRAGRIVCCDTNDCRNGLFLVSWFFHTRTPDTTDDCFDANTPRAFPPDSTMWVDPERVPLGVCFDQCGILQQGRPNDPNCILFETDDGRTYNLFDGDWLPRVISPAGDFDFGDRVRVQGLRSIVRPGGIDFPCPEQHGDIYNPVITPCAPAGNGNGNGNGNANGQTCPQDNLTIGFGTNGIRLFRDPTCPATPRTFSGCVNVTVATNFRAQLSLKITPLAGINGAWQGTITPNVVSAGQSNVLVCITANAVNIAGIPAGQSVQVANVSILAVPQ